MLSCADDALKAGLTVAVCSTSNERAVSKIRDVLLGPEAAAKIKVFAGDIVPKKKPDPAVYLLAAKELNLDPSRCVCSHTTCRDVITSVQSRALFVRLLEPSLPAC